MSEEGARPQANDGEWSSFTNLSEALKENSLEVLENHVRKAKQLLEEFAPCLDEQPGIIPGAREFSAYPGVAETIRRQQICHLVQRTDWSWDEYHHHCTM
jgi:hypothetical protein